MPFFIIFIILPLLELVVFIDVADEAGFFGALLLLVLAALAGSALLRRQGLENVRMMRTALEGRSIPAGAMFDGFCVTAAGFLLVVPGFITDALAIMLLVPPARGLLRKLLGRRTAGHARAPQDGVIEGEFERVEETPLSVDKNSS